MDLQLLHAPAVCAVHGAMVGGAAAIFLQADVRVADRSATFQHGNLSRGVCPIAGYSRSLVEAVGIEAAFRYYLTDRTITAAQALASGLVQATIAGDAAPATTAHVAWTDLSKRFVTSAAHTKRSEHRCMCR